VNRIRDKMKINRACDALLHMQSDNQSIRACKAFLHQLRAPALVILQERLAGANLRVR